MVATGFHDGNDDADFTRVVYHDLMIRLAVLVGATEAAGFEVRQVSPTVSLKLLEHVRPDKSSSEVRAAAVEAFEEIVLPCVEKGKEGAIEVAQHRLSAEGSQFCLVTLTRDADHVVRVVSAFIVRCAGRAEAKDRLQLLRGSNSPYRKVRLRPEGRAAAESGQRMSAVATSPPGWSALRWRMSPSFGSIGWVGALIFYLLMVAGIAALLYIPWSLLKGK